MRCVRAWQQLTGRQLPAATIELGYRWAALQIPVQYLPGVALAASFAMLAVIPPEQFRQIAIAMALGVVLDAIAVRSLLVPALVALFGRVGMWPGNRRARPEPTPATAPAPVRAGDQP